LLERAGGARVTYVSVPSSLHRAGGTYLVVVRSDLDVLDWPDEATLQAIATKPLPLAGPSREALRSVVAMVREAAALLEHVEVDKIDRETSGQALYALAEPLRRLAGLQRTLTMQRELGR
jgi:hypothetical protein